MASKGFLTGHYGYFTLQGGEVLVFDPEFRHFLMDWCASESSVNSTEKSIEGKGCRSNTRGPERIASVPDLYSHDLPSLPWTRATSYLGSSRDPARKGALAFRPRRLVAERMERESSASEYEVSDSRKEAAGSIQRRDAMTLRKCKRRRNGDGACRGSEVAIQADIFSFESRDELSNLVSCKVSSQHTLSPPPQGSLKPSHDLSRISHWISLDD